MREKTPLQSNQGRAATQQENLRKEASWASRRAAILKLMPSVVLTTLFTDKKDTAAGRRNGMNADGAWNVRAAAPVKTTSTY
jgi:hypothetical protein